MSKLSPVSKLWGYFTGLKNEFGLKTVLLVISMYAGVRGNVRTFVGNVALPFYQRGGWRGNELQLNSSIAFVPWTLQGFVGILSDTFPLFGYYRTSYYILYNVLTTLAMTIMFLVPMTVDTISTTVPILLFMLCELSTAWGGVLVVGKFTLLMKKNPNNNGNIVVFTYFCTTIGSIFPAFSVGVLAENLEVRYLFLIFLPFSLQSFVFIFTGCMIEDKCEPGKSNRFDFTRLEASWRMVVLAFLLASAGTGSLFAGLFGSIKARMLYFVCSSLILIVSNFLLLPFMIAKANFYIYLQLLSYVNIGGAMEYYLTGDELCVPEGPQFGYIYYRTYVSAVGVLAQLLACLVFQAVFTGWKYRPIFWFSTVIKVLASLVDLAIVMRWNIALGIPDKFIYIIGTGIIYECTEMLDVMPAQLMVSRLAPTSATGTMTSVIACFANFGSSFNRTIGAWFMELFGINALPQGPGCNFDNLHWMLILSHCILPLSIIPLSFICIPDLYVNDQFADNEFASGKYLFPNLGPHRPYEDNRVLSNKA